MKILVTGAAGYIGSILVPELLQKGYEVIAIDNLMYNQASLLNCCSDNKLDIVRGDARDKSLIAKYLKVADAILPLACLTGAPICQMKPLEAQSVIVDAVKMILDLRSKNQIIIYPNTNSGYGIGKKDELCTEESSLEPVSLYGKLKVKAEKALMDTGNCISLRLATVFGVSPRMRIDLLVNDFVYRAVTDHFIVLFEAHFKRNFIHLRDVARVFIHALNNFEKMKDQVYNVGLDDANLSKWQLCEEIKKQVSEFYFVEAKVGKDPDNRDYIVSNEKIKKTGYKPDFSLQMGIAELIKGYIIVKKNSFSNV